MSQLVVMLRAGAAILMLSLVTLLVCGPLLRLEQDQRVGLAVSLLAALLTVVSTLPRSIGPHRVCVLAGFIVIAALSGCWLSADLLAGARPGW
jgi:hypothetical protein